jgi:hypothetical protein
VSSAVPSATTYNETTVIDSLVDFSAGTCSGCFVNPLFPNNVINTNSKQEGMLLWQEVAFMGDAVFKQFIKDVCVASGVSVIQHRRS